MDWKEVILPLLLAAIAAAPGILALLKGRNKEKADVAATYIDSAKDLLEEYRAKIQEVEASYRAKLEEIEATVADQAETIRCQERKIAKQQAEIEKMRAEQDEFLQGLTALCTQIRGLGHDPVWEPENQ